jgi:hypothetical protein
MNLNLFFPFLGHNPKGLTLKFSQGLCRKGPATLPANNSLHIFFFHNLRSLQSRTKTWTMNLSGKLFTKPLGLCPKKGKNKFRFIFHLSHPHGDSVIDFISEEFSTVHYTNIAYAINWIKTFDTCFLAAAKIIKSFKYETSYHLA